MTRPDTTNVPFLNVTLERAFMRDHEVVHPSKLSRYETALERSRLTSASGDFDTVKQPTTML